MTKNERVRELMFEARWAAEKGELERAKMLKSAAVRDGVEAMREAMGEYVIATALGGAETGIA